MAAALDQIADFPALVEYLRDELEWPIPEDVGLEEATYDVTPEEIGLKAEAIGGGIEIKQLRPLNRAQPWGVFFLNLPSEKLPVTLVRNILGKLAVKKRASANKAQQAAFAKHDLLFIAATGYVGERRLAFAHFADDEVKGDAATLKVLGWDSNDTPRRLGLTEASLKTKLHWPDDAADADRWRRQWGEAFAHSDTRTVVRDSRAMAKALAALARRIRERAKELISAQTEAGSLVKLHKAFKEALIDDLTPEGFADTYAQTIAYGLLSAAISRSSGALVQENVADVVHPTSPFLKEMLGTFIEAGGRRSGGGDAGLDFDELGITEVVELLRNADMEAVLADFDRRNPDEDPVIHFYELFLKEYDAEQKVRRGVFYTPRPVVGFIVRSVDEVLRTEFGLEDGLASTATWGETIAARPEIELPEGVKQGDPFVRILDPATGTGTFLVECIDLIHKTMVGKWKAAGKTLPEIEALWNEYVPKHLLPRLTGFELMMAPYAIAHVKLGLKLADTGYRFRSEARAQIFLTNALEPAKDLDMQLAFMSAALAHEATAANATKRMRQTVIVGNPPYAGISANMQQFARALIEPYRYLEGIKIKEKGALQFEKNLNDDYLKFLRFSEAKISDAVGVIGLITNNGYIDSATLRGVRWSILTSANLLRILDLHGDADKREVGTTGEPDENVFDIKRGVAVAVLARMGGTGQAVFKADLLGERDRKYAALKSAGLGWKRILPARPLFKLSAAVAASSELEDWAPLTDVFPANTTGFESGRDEILTDFDRQLLLSKIMHFASAPEAAVRSDFSVSKAWGAHLFRKRASIKYGREGEAFIRNFLFAPFDERFCYYRRDLLKTNSDSIGRHLGSGDNVALLGMRQASLEGGFSHIGVASSLPNNRAFYSTKGKVSGFPLWLLPQGTETRTLPNIAPAFAGRVTALTGLTWDDCVEERKHGAPGGIVPKKPHQTAMLAKRRERGEPGKSFGPQDLFDYIYAVLHSPAYRQRYADYLKSDFARIPLPGSRALFEALVPLGGELVALHLLDAETLPVLKDPTTVRFAGNGEARVAKKPEYNAALGRVEIGATRWFETVPQAAWDFHLGGYQPARKWLKDRAARGGQKPSPGRLLTGEDILHYRRMIVALTRTAELMPKIDGEIEKHGGWPEAFRGMTDAPGADAA